MQSPKTGLLYLGLALMAAGCVSIPDFDSVEGTPAEFQSEINSLDGYPDSSVTPERPSNLRSDASWDRAARALLSNSNAFDSLGSGSTLATDAEISAAKAQLLALVNAYKLDDPKPY